MWRLETGMRRLERLVVGELSVKIVWESDVERVEQGRGRVLQHTLKGPREVECK